MHPSTFKNVATFFCGQFEFGFQFTDTGGSRVGTKPGQERILPFLRSRNARGDNIFMRPLSDIAAKYLLIDDLDATQVNMHISRPGRMVVETSQDNFQVWVHSQRPLSDNEKKIWLRRLHSDPGAAPCKRWGRAPGFSNRKPERWSCAGFPYARLAYVDFNMVDIPVLTDGNVTRNAVRTSLIAPFRQLQVTGNKSRNDFETGDNSQTDFRYSMWMVSHDFSDMEMKSRLLAERHDWSHHSTDKQREDYLARTIKKARVWVENRTQWTE